MKPMLLPLSLIAIVSAVLLLMDDSRAPGTQTGPARVALIQHAAQAALDDSANGVIMGLASRGYVDGRNVHVERFNAQGDLPTASDIARRVTDGSYDLVVTLSTVSLQTVAAANQVPQVRHVFGVVTDPTHAGVGFSPDDPLDHPRYMAGYGAFASVEDVIVLARQFNPALKRLGLVWHTAESNSLAYTEVARKVCASMGIELLEANAETSSSVGEAAASLTARGVDALLVTGDVVVLVAVDALISVARKAGVPLISIVPPNARKGALFDLGADYEVIGQEIGQLAADVLGGRDPATVPFENRVPQKLMLNLTALEGLNAGWSLPDGLRERARVVIDASGEHANPDARYRPD